MSPPAAPAAASASARREYGSGAKSTAPAIRGPVGRLVKRSEFLAARRGKKSRGPYFLIESIDRGDGGPPRVGFTVTKKVGNAVTRNRIRRRLKEACRVYAGGDMAVGRDYVIVGRREILHISFDTLKDELARRIRGISHG